VTSLRWPPVSENGQRHPGGLSSQHLTGDKSADLFN